MNEINETKVMSNEAESMAAPTSGIARRRLLRAGMTAAPLMLTLSGRSAMATNTGTPVGLSPMAWASVAPKGTYVAVSHTVGTHPLGKSPDTWEVEAKKDEDKVTPELRTNLRTKFNNVFDSGGDRRFKEILKSNNASDKFVRHFSAAYMNVQTQGSYAITLDELKHLYSTRTLVHGSKFILDDDQIMAFLRQTWS